MYTKLLEKTNQPINLCWKNVSFHFFINQFLLSQNPACRTYADYFAHINLKQNLQKLNQKTLQLAPSTPSHKRRQMCIRSFFIDKLFPFILLLCKCSYYFSENNILSTSCFYLQINHFPFCQWANWPVNCCVHVLPGGSTKCPCRSEIKALA